MDKEPIKFREEKPKKIIYRKLKGKDKIVSCLAILVMAILMFSWFAMVAESRAPEPPVPVYNDPGTEPAPVDDYEPAAPVPEKFQPTTPGISGHSSDTYHV